MPRPEYVSPHNYNFLRALYNDGDFSIALGKWEDGSVRIGMRWNGKNEDVGYPKLFSNPVWFILPETLTVPIVRGILGCSATHEPTVADALVNIIHRSQLHELCKEVIGAMGYKSISNLSVGQLVGTILKSKTRVIMPITIEPTDDSYDQIIFERHLKDLMNILLALLPAQLTLIFVAGGKFRLPDWFFDLCVQNGIEIRFVEPRTEEIKAEDIMALGLD